MSRWKLASVVLILLLGVGRQGFTEDTYVPDGTCPPDWGDWYTDDEDQPIITITPEESEGGTIQVTVTLDPGQKKRDDQSDCGNSSDTEPLNIDEESLGGDWYVLDNISGDYIDGGPLVFDGSEAEISFQPGVGSYTLSIDAWGTAPDTEDTFTGSKTLDLGDDLPPDCSFSFFTSVDEATGARYRKIGLDGFPISEAKPPAKEQSDREPEETYIDAFDHTLAHQVTDIYLPFGGTDLTLSARRNWRPEIWNLQNGLKPGDFRPDQPFGAGWTSNLTPNIHFVRVADFSENDCAGRHPPPDYAYVTDENGVTYRFLIQYLDSSGQTMQFFPLPEPGHQQEVITCSLGSNGQGFLFKRKYGTILQFGPANIGGIPIPIPRNDPPSQNGSTETHWWAALNTITDQYGTQVVYSGHTDLVPGTITCRGRSITISASGGRIQRIKDPRGNYTIYEYASSAAGQVLQTVKRCSGITPMATTLYHYEIAQELDPTPRLQQPQTANVFYYLDLQQITDPNSKSYRFTYAFDKSRWDYINAGNSDRAINQWYQPAGSPRNITNVTLPDNLGRSTFVNYSSVKVKVSGSSSTIEGAHSLVVNDAGGSAWTYNFVEPTIINLDAFDHLSTQSDDPRSSPRLILWGRMVVTTLGGILIADFDKAAGMALSGLKDVTSAVGTTYIHTDSSGLSASSLGLPFDAWNQFPFKYHGDPTTQINPDNTLRQFFYDPIWHVTNKIIDEKNRRTEYDIDPLNGNKTRERIYGENGVLAQDTSFEFHDTRFPGFLTRKTVKALATAPGEVDLVTNYTADSFGNVQAETVAYGTLNLTTSYQYDENNNKTSVTDPRSHPTGFTYDALNRLTKTDPPGPSNIQYFYDPRGNKVREQDERGFSTLWSYDGLNRVVKQARDLNNNSSIDEPADLVTKFTYNALGFKLEQRSPNGDLTDFESDNLKRVKKMTTPVVAVGNGSTPVRLQTSYTYGPNSGGIQFEREFQPTHVTDPRGFTKDMEYDPRFRLTKQTIQYGKNPNVYAVSTFGYDLVGNRTSETDPLIKITSYEYDALNRRTKTTYHDQTFVQDFYTSTGLMWKQRNERNFYTIIEHDAAGRPTTVTGPAVDGGQPVTITGYDPTGNVIRVTRVTSPVNEQWDYVYDDRNRKTQEKLPIVDFIDEAGNTVQGTEANRPVIVTGYDYVGNRTSVTDPRGAITYTQYDRANRPVKVISPPVGVEETNIPSTTTRTAENVYDKNGNITQTWIGYGGGAEPGVRRTVLNSYDALNRLKSTTDAKDIVVRNEYDENGNRTGLVDGKNHRTAFEYDGLNRNTKVTDLSGNSITFTYDGVNKTGRTDAMGQGTTYTYDDRHRLKTVTYAGRSQDNRTYNYDDAGNLLSVLEPGKSGKADIGLTYDALNRIKTETSNGFTHAYTYDLAGNRTQTVYGGTNRTLVATYDALNRLQTLTENGRVTTYLYDPNGNVRRLEQPNAQVITKTYDSLNALVSLSSSYYVYGYTYDLARNLKHSTEFYPANAGLNREVINSYDPINRLVTETISGANAQTTAYTYDDANNRTQKTVGGVTTTYSYNDLNQLTGYVGGALSASYSYDFNGNRKTDTGPQGTESLSFDYENRLVTLTVNGGYGPGPIHPLGAHTYNYTYDYRTRRAERSEDNFVTSVIFSGGTSVQERASGNLRVEYVRGSEYGGGVGGILYTLRQGAPSFTHYNNRGDVVVKANAAGALTYEATYEAFGTHPQETGATLDRQKANTKEEDPTGLLNEGFRYRDLTTGVFITRDPAGSVDGPNLYTYVRQNPWSKFDPEGLNETWGGDNWFANWILPDPVAHYQTAQKGAETMFDGSQSGIDRTAGGLSYLGNGMMAVLSVVPGEAAIEGGIERLAVKAAARAAGRDAVEVVTEKVEQKVAQQAEQTAEQTASKTLRDTAMEIHDLAHPIKQKNQTIALNEQILPDGTVRTVGSANSTAGLTAAQKAAMEEKGIAVVKPAPASTGNHAEHNIIEAAPEGTKGTKWGISSGKDKKPTSCESCAPKVEKFGGEVQD